jgi:predicted transcriptional regulator
VPVHSSTVLRLVRALPDPPAAAAAPRVTGVDDFALRKGHVYGTVVADAESGDVIDVLPDREAGTLEEWLKARPGAEVICRDRAGAYAEGAAAGAPAAIQVADRWHLWHNLGEYAEKAVVAHRGCLTAAATGVPDGPAGDAAPGQQAPEDVRAAALRPGPDGLRDVHGRERALVSRTRERHAAVHELLQAGRSQREAAEILGLSRNTVNRFARAPGAATLLVKATSRESKLDPFKPWISQRWNEGLTTAAALHAEMAATLGWTGTCRPSSATSASSARPTGGPGLAGPPGRSRQPCRSPRPARSPAGCCPAPAALTPMTRPGSPPSRPAARTWTPWPGTSAASPR